MHEDTEPGQETIGIKVSDKAGTVEGARMIPELGFILVAELAQKLKYILENLSSRRLVLLPDRLSSQTKEGQ